MKYIPILLLILLVFGCQPETPSPQQKEIFEQVWQDFGTTYPYFAHKGVNWDSIYHIYEQRVSSTQQDAFFSQMAEMLSSLRDIHVNLNGNEQEFRYHKRSDFPSNPATHARKYVSNIQLENNRVTFGDITGTNIAYIRIKTFEGSVNNYTDFPTETVVSAIAKKEGLIIDIRDNPGGKEDFATDFASRFVPDSRIYKQVRSREGPNYDDFGAWIPEYLSPADPIVFEHPIVILTNRGCYSAAESFVLMMKTLPQTVVVGDTTGGATGNPIAIHLPNGWRYTVPTLQATSVDGQLIEDLGIVPDIRVQMTPISLQEGRDMMIEEALELF